MGSRISGRDDEVYAVLEETLPIIDRVLVRYYGFLEEEAEAFEDTLCVWFHRVVQRHGGMGAPSELRAQLIFVACKYARAFQLAKLGGAAKTSDQYRSSLARAPEDVAFQLVTHLPATQP